MKIIPVKEQEKHFTEKKLVPPLWGVRGLLSRQNIFFIDYGENTDINKNAGKQNHRLSQ